MCPRLVLMAALRFEVWELEWILRTKLLGRHVGLEPTTS